MTFSSMEELKNYILKCSEFAIVEAQKKVANIINHFLTQYYREFEPEVYVRTEQLLRSLTKSRVIRTDNGWVAEVYFDLSALDYSNRIVPSQFSSYGSGHNTYHRENWTHENDAWVLETAMTGGNTGRPHGGYESGTKIWNESLNILNKEAIDILKKKLIEAGIPVKE